MDPGVSPNRSRPLEVARLPIWLGVAIGLSRDPGALGLRQTAACRRFKGQAIAYGRTATAATSLPGRTVARDPCPTCPPCFAE